MYIAFIQLLDLYHYNTLGLFLAFFVISWVFFGVKLTMSFKYKGITKALTHNPSVSIIIPVVDEPMEVWQRTLAGIKAGVGDLKYEVIIVCNGAYSQDNYDYAKAQGYKVFKLKQADKRYAIEEGVKHATNEITILLDSDTMATPYSIQSLVHGFVDPQVGGIVPLQKVHNREKSIVRRMCDWFEDMRFFYTMPGLSYTNSVPCLIGRLFAIRTDLLKKYIPEFKDQYFLGVRCLSGDDRLLTSYLLKDGYKTLLDRESLVYTECPDTISKFVKQRLRWSRTSFRETILSLPWLFKKPYVATVMLGDILLRWMIFAVYISFLLAILKIVNTPHWLATVVPQIDYLWIYILGGLIGMTIGAYIKQIPHLKRYPQDILYVPVFLFFMVFILTPVEWFGNLTIREASWMTRRTQ